MPYKFTKDRKKLNFMVDVRLVAELQQTIPEGERSNFINDLISDGLIRYKRRKAFTDMDRLRDESNLRMSTEDLLNARDYCRN